MVASSNKQETDMNMQINLLSDDALDAVSGGRPNIISEGHVAIAGSSSATGTQIGGGGGTISGGSSLLNLIDGILGVPQPAGSGAATGGYHY
jgi:hypothetical protein